jgi:hypothetical protein
MLLASMFDDGSVAYMGQAPWCLPSAAVMAHGLVPWAAKPHAVLWMPACRLQVSCYHLRRPLEDGAAKQLLREWASISNDEQLPEDIQALEEIVITLCGGLPLHLTIVGGMLRPKQTVGQVLSEEARLKLWQVIEALHGTQQQDSVARRPHLTTPASYMK